MVQICDVHAVKRSRRSSKHLLDALAGRDGPWWHGYELMKQTEQGFAEV